MVRLAGKSLTETVDKVHLISERMRTRRGESLCGRGVQNDIRAGPQKTFVIKPHASIRVQSWLFCNIIYFKFLQIPSFCDFVSQGNKKCDYYFRVDPLPSHPPMVEEKDSNVLSASEEIVLLVNKRCRMKKDH